MISTNNICHRDAQNGFPFVKATPIKSVKPAKPDVTFSSKHESGSIGNIERVENNHFRLSLRDDNNNFRLPNAWRTWFYFKMEGVPIKKEMRLDITRLGFPHSFNPVYSYNNKDWHRFREDEVKMSPNCSVDQLSTCQLTITKTFKYPKVWIARTFPYTTRDLSDFLNSIRSHPSVKIETLGYSPYKHKPIYGVTISDDKLPAPNGKKKQLVFIHARTHPAETGSSFLLEGLIKKILSNDNLGNALRENFIFKTVPMHNPDGVHLGNYRTNAFSENLEVKWNYNSQSPVPTRLSNDVPRENQIVSNFMYDAFNQQEHPPVLALNLHSSNSEPDDPAFFYPHFGSNPNKYTEKERELWRKQINFIHQVTAHYNGRIQTPPEEGGKGFLNSSYPETWWWHNFQDSINAITLETVYGKAQLGHWITKEDYHKLGEAVAKAMIDIIHLTDILSHIQAPVSPPPTNIKSLTEKVFSANLR